MRKVEIQVHKVYAAKVSGQVVPVRIDYAIPGSGWSATNLRTGRSVRIKSATRLRFEILPNDGIDKSERAAMLAEHVGDDGMTAAEWSS